MRGLRGFVPVFIVFTVVMTCVSALAFDTSVYEGVWEHKSKDLTIKMYIGSDGPRAAVSSVIVDGKDIGKLHYEFLYGKYALVPFLTVSAGDIYEGYSLYLILCNVKKEFDTTTGYYVFTKGEDD